jgi:hypothetical protein
MSQNTCTGGVYEVGDQVNLAETFTDFVAPTWAITLYLSINGTAATNIAGTGSGSAWAFAIPAATTANLSAGTYDYAYYALNGTNRQTAKTGQLTFIPNLAASQTASITQQQLDALNATILALSGSGNQSCSFNGQSFTKRDLNQLMAMKRELEAKLYREQRAAANLRGVVDDGNIGNRFGPTDAGYPYSFPWPWGR